MALRYLKYLTNYGNTIVAESATPFTLGPNEAQIYTAFIIPTTQPLYLYREDTGDVIPNTDQNIENYLNSQGVYDSVDYLQFSGYTATTETRLDGIEADILYISGITSGITAGSGFVTTSNFNSYTGATETRLDDIEADVIYLSGQTASKVSNTKFNSYTGVTETRLDDIEADVVYLSGQTASKVSNTKFNSYTGTTETRLDDIEADVIYLSGETASKLDTADFNVYSAYTKTYIDSAAAGLDPKQSVRVATTAPLGTGSTYIASGGTAGTGSFTGAPSSVDGITLVNGNRILVKNQADAKQNGIYIRISAGVWYRSSDMDGTPASEVSGGAYAFVETGSTLAASGWVLDGDGILALNTDPIVWSQFSAANSYQAGVGITINSNTIALNGAAIAGNNIDWSGSQLNLQITGGTLGPALDGKVDDSTFNSYTGASETRFDDIEADVIYLSGQTASKVSNTKFNSYTGATETRLDDIEADVIYLSGQTASKVSNTKFNSYTGTTETRISGIEDDVTYLSGQTASKVSNTKFNSYTGATETRIDGIEDDVIYLSGETAARLRTTVFNTYTATTSNELYLITSASNNLNVVTPVAITWNREIRDDSAYNFTGGTLITVLDAGQYEVSYLVNVIKTSGGGSDSSIGVAIFKNISTQILETTTGDYLSGTNTTGSLVLPPVRITLAANDKLQLFGYRTGGAGSISNVANSTFIRIKNLNN